MRYMYFEQNPEIHFCEEFPDDPTQAVVDVYISDQGIISSNELNLL